MNVAILGYGVDGQSAAKYWHSKGDDITICDQKTDIEIPDWATARLGEHYLSNLDGFDLIVRSPGLHPSEIVKANPESTDISSKVTSCINEFFAKCPAPIIGVTGTKGKGTTCTLIYELLKAAAKKAFLGGNIGTVPLDFLQEITPDSWVVLELSNFQLIDFVGRPKIGVCLMVVPEHQDWHSDMADYTLTKSRLFMRQKPEDVAIYFADNQTSKKIASAGAGQKIPYFASPGAYVNGNIITIANQEICKTDELKLLGSHNWQNVCAAITAVWQADVRSVSTIHSVVTEFTGLPHRLELVREIGKITYYNDSFAATPDAAIAALTAIPGKKVVILGGFDRKLPIAHLAKACQTNAATIRTVILIGASAERLKSELDKVSFTNYQVMDEKSMKRIVKAAKIAAHPGDNVLLSPGFASFDMFKNFEDRGNQFKAAVKAL